MARQSLPDPDDYFSDTRMSIPDHLEDLRWHLLRAIYGFVIATLGSFFIGSYVLEFIAHPVEVQLREYWERYYLRRRAEILDVVRTGDAQSMAMFVPKMRLDRKVMTDWLGLPAREDEVPWNPFPHPIPNLLKKLDLGEILDKQEFKTDRYLFVQPDIEPTLDWWIRMNMTMKPPSLSTLSVQEAFMVYLMVSLMTGFVISSPWVFYQVWSFVAAGLYPHEKKLVNVYLPFSIVLFLVGVGVCEFLVLPKGIQALLWFNEWLSLQPDLRLSEWLWFAIVMPLIFGLSFQTPMVMIFMERIGAVDVQVFRAARKVALMVIVVFAAVITPTTDPVSMLLLAIPMALLYELGIRWCEYWPRSEFEDFEESGPDELIEV